MSVDSPYSIVDIRVDPEDPGVRDFRSGQPLAGISEQSGFTIPNSSEDPMPMSRYTLPLTSKDLDGGDSLYDNSPSGNGNQYF